MEVRFKTKLLKRCYEKSAIAVRQFGPEVARRYIERVNILVQCRSASDLERLAPLEFHPLKGERAGQYAIRLTGFMRLIIRFQDRAMTIVRVEEVSKHYGD